VSLSHPCPTHHFQQFNLSALTHQSTILDPQKLEYLNKNHLVETWSQRNDGLNSLANRVIVSVGEPSQIGMSASCIFGQEPALITTLASMQSWTAQSKSHWLYMYGITLNCWTSYLTQPTESDDKNP
jgi:hypothetical protein